MPRHPKCHDCPKKVPEDTVKLYRGADGEERCIGCNADFQLAQRDAESGSDKGKEQALPDSATWAETRDPSLPRPTAEELAELFDKFGQWAKVAHHLGVSVSKVHGWRSAEQKEKPKVFPLKEDASPDGDLQVTFHKEVRSTFKDLKLVVANAQDGQGIVGDHVCVLVDGEAMVEKYPGVWRKIAAMILEQEKTS